MILFVSTGPQLRRYGSPYLGQLLNPKSTNRPLTDMLWAADNFCFVGLDRARYIRMLRQIAAVADRSRLVFVVVPDVVGNADATRARFRLWAPVLRYYDLPMAYVLQDGETAAGVPWDQIAAVFVGGSTQFKESRQVVHLVSEAKSRHLWVHMGRVNSLRRLRFAQSIGCDSIDGQQFSRFKDTYIPKWLPYLATAQGAIIEAWDVPNVVSQRDVPTGGRASGVHRRSKEVV